MSYHETLDRLSEEQAKQAIGTTCKGIGPTYTDKVSRRGIRAEELRDTDTLAKKILEKLEEHRRRGRG